LTVYTVSGNIHQCRCRLVSWMTWNLRVPTHPRHQPAATLVNIIGCCKYSQVLLIIGENIARNMKKLTHFIHYYSAVRSVRQEPELSKATGMALARCFLVKFLGVGRHYFPPPLDVLTLVTRCLHVHNDTTDPSSEI
jgi:hypothetical protein